MYQFLHRTNEQQQESYRKIKNAKVETSKVTVSIMQGVFHTYRVFKNRRRMFVRSRQIGQTIPAIWVIQTWLRTRIA